jgi:phosphatidylglycerophosphatase A
MPAPEPTSNLLRRAFVTGLFSGYVPIAPGTAGSVVGIILALIPVSPLVFAILIVAVFLLGVHQSAVFSIPERRDPSFVVIDEVVGMWIAVFLLPRSILAFVLAFLTFRVFDILKPFPARQAESLPGGWGIMTDDLIAGIYANLVVRLFLFLMETV